MALRGGTESGNVGTPLAIRHPEVRAQRASKDERPGPSPFEMPRKCAAPQDDGDGLSVPLRSNIVIL
jgi:hypothetical protein